MPKHIVAFTNAGCRAVSVCLCRCVGRRITSCKMCTYFENRCEIACAAGDNDVGTWNLDMCDSHEKSNTAKMVSRKHSEPTAKRVISTWLTVSHIHLIIFDAVSHSLDDDASLNPTVNTPNRFNPLDDGNQYDCCYRCVYWSWLDLESSNIAHQLVSVILCTLLLPFFWSILLF